MGNPDLGPNLFTGLHLQEALRPLAAGMDPEEGHFLWKGDRDHLAKHKEKKSLSTRGETKSFARGSEGSNFYL